MSGLNYTRVRAREKMTKSNRALRGFDEVNIKDYSKRIADARRKAEDIALAKELGIPLSEVLGPVGP
jgi:hypothetical protein